MLLAVDAGNTRVKYAVFDKNAMLDSGNIDALALHDSLAAVVAGFAIADIIIASVGTLQATDFEVPSARCHFLTHDSRFPFTNLYQTPQTLGIDRMALAAGAVLRFPGTDRLIIDAGTCITYDFINGADEYLGGAISPGLRLRYESLHQYTARLPLLQRPQSVALTGRSTAESIHSGVVNGVANEVDGFIERYRERASNFIIILTGGDGDFLAKQLKNTIFAHSNFLLESLNAIFQYQNQA